MKVYQSEKSINLFPTVNFTWGSVGKVTINLNNQPPSLYIKLPFWFTIHLWAFLFPPFFILWIPSSVYLLPECSFPLSFLTFFHFLIFFYFLLLPSMQSFCNLHKPSAIHIRPSDLWSLLVCVLLTYSEVSNCMVLFFLFECHKN